MPRTEKGASLDAMGQTDPSLFYGQGEVLPVLSQANKPKNTCMRCDNRHGCQDEEPFCLASERTEEEKNLSGSQWMRKRNQLKRCVHCSQYRRCLPERNSN
jgi:hypothetical protein